MSEIRELVYTPHTVGQSYDSGFSSFACCDEVDYDLELVNVTY